MMMFLRIQMTRQVPHALMTMHLMMLLTLIHHLL